jgi:hypothetical protein
VIYSYNEGQRDALFSTLFWLRTLHVLDSSTVHHQESQHYTAIRIFQYVSNKMQLYTVYLYLETALYVTGVTSTHHQERIQLYLKHLVFVRPLMLPAAIAAGSINGLTNTRCCRYSYMRS